MVSGFAAPVLRGIFWFPKGIKCWLRSEVISPWVMKWEGVDLKRLYTRQVCWHNAAWHLVFFNNIEIFVSMSVMNWPNTIPKCPCSISHNAPFRTEMYTFLFWMEHCGIWSRGILGFVKLVYWSSYLKSMMSPGVVLFSWLYIERMFS